MRWNILKEKIEMDLEVRERSNCNDKMLSQRDLYGVLPFGKTKIQQLISSNQLPLLKIWKDYITTYNILEDWIREHIGDEIYY